MTRKITFKPQEAEFCRPGDNTTNKYIDVKLDGKIVGIIDTSIRDLYQDRSNPGYSVTVSAVITGTDKKFYRNSTAFSNRTAKEARENRTSYIKEAKEWAKKVVEREL